MSPPSLLERANASTIDVFSFLLKGLARPRIERWPEATALSCESPSVSAHRVLVTDTPSDPGALIRRAQGFFGDGIPWMLMASSHLKDVMGPAVEANGMVAGRDDPGMLLEPIPSRPAGSSTVTVRHVTTLEGLQDFQDVAAGIFFPMSTLKRMFPSIPDREGSGEGGPQLFVCYDNGKPVATSMLLVSLGLGGIFFVGTREEARKRGYGTAATWAAVLAARQEGCDACFLTASDVGLPIYERMGFRKVLKYLQWHTPGPKDG